ncbi:MAG: hypothetical protein LBU83_01830 [Bacteroidales bacterium]|jgi:hypothetical protein|nr:hypothetical protein [Bacteroidales bacterium]
MKIPCTDKGIFIMKYLFLIFCLILCFCYYAEDPGYCSNPPKLSKRELLFSAQEGVDSVVVNTQYWWFEISMKNSSECEFWGRESDPDYCNNNYCRGNDLMKIECPWFSVTRTGEYTLIVSVNQNETGEERKQSIGMRSGNCGIAFSITQSVE